MCNKADKRTKFLENIRPEFTKIEGALDSLDDKLLEARRDDAVTGDEIVGYAVKANRTATRCINVVSDWDTVDNSKIDTKKFDELDQIFSFGEDGAFDDERRNLHLTTSLRVTARVSEYTISLQSELQKAHNK